MKTHIPATEVPNDWEMFEFDARDLRGNKVRSIMIYYFKDGVEMGMRNSVSTWYDQLDNVNITTQGRKWSQENLNKLRRV